MKKAFFVFLSVVSVLIFSTISAEINRQRIEIKEEMIKHLIGIQNTFESTYAPKDWKRDYVGWDLENEIQCAIEKVIECPDISLKKYHRILLAFFNSMQDYHVGVHFHSTESAFLPFRLRGAQGRYFVVSVEEEGSDVDCPLDLGDEVLAFDGFPIEEIVDSLIVKDQRSLLNETDRELASIFVTQRMGALGHYVPKGTVKILVSKKDRSTALYELTWDYQAELIQDLHHKKLLPRISKTKSLTPKKFGEEVIKNSPYSNMTAPFYAVVAGTLKPERMEAFPLGGRRGDLPFLGKPLWEWGDDKFFFSYIFETNEKKKIGYLRIPHFMGSGEDLDEEDDDENRQDFRELNLLAGSLQRRTDGLVIDLTDNIGGSLFCLLPYISLLTDRAIPFYKQKIAMTQETIAEALQSIMVIDIYMNLELSSEEKMSLERIREYCLFLVGEWNEGRYLSDPVHFYGISEILPHPQGSYKKPILVLVNSLDFSCADFFPALLQDSDRAIIFGTKTAGAGGAVLGHSYPNRLGIANYSYTATIAERENKQPLENLGVTPDIIYEVTPDDLQNGYEGYKRAVQEALKELLR